MTAETVPLILDPYDYHFHEDPYPYYRRLRDEAPLYRNDTLNFWALTRHADVHKGFRNSTELSNTLGVSLDPISRNPEAYRTMSFLAMDDPAHLRLRTLVSKGFTPRRIRELEARVIELAKEHLDTALESESFDFIAEFAGKLPMDVISELMGVPVEDRVRLRSLADEVMHREDGVADVPMAAIEASMELLVYYADMVAQRRRKPTDDLTTALLEAEIDGDRLGDDEIMAFLFLMVVGVAHAGGFHLDLDLIFCRVTDLDLLDRPRLVELPDERAFCLHCNPPTGCGAEIERVLCVAS